MEALRISRRGRRLQRNRRRYRNALLEALEPKVFLTVTPVPDTGSMVQNGTNLQAQINAAVLGDTLVLTAGAVYLAPAGGFTLPYKTGSGTLTIESDDMASL